MLDSLVKEVFLSTSRWQLLVLSLSQPQSQFANKRCSSWVWCPFQYIFYVLRKMVFVGWLCHVIRLIILWSFVCLMWVKQLKTHSAYDVSRLLLSVGFLGRFIFSQMLKQL